MPNYSVNYIRSNRSLLTLQAEIRARFPGREQNKGFVSGYGKGNLTGHNADNQGITHAYDIGVDIESDGSGLLPADALWLVEHFRRLGKAGFAPLRAGYVIHDISTTTTPAPRIAGAFNGWEWQVYGGSSPHSDHIHISTVDLLWGDVPNPLASAFDSTETWGVISGKIDTPATSSKPSGAKKPEHHWTVSKGDTLARAAKHFGVTVDVLAKYNGIKNPNRIEVGERIWPPTGADTYVVDPGETLSGIVAWYHKQGHKALTVAKLQNANGINDPAKETKVGMRLQIPK